MEITLYIVKNSEDVKPFFAIRVRFSGFEKVPPTPGEFVEPL
jgi:hypothetical protein